MWIHFLLERKTFMLKDSVATARRLLHRGSVFNGFVRPAHSVVTTLRRREDRVRGATRLRDHRVGGATRPLSEFAEYLMSGGDGFVDHLRRVSAREEQGFELTARHVDAAIN